MSLKTRIPLSALIAAFVATAVPAAAQMRGELPSPGYRQGLPAVNAPPPAANPNAGNYAASASFAAWYARAGRPQILLFWNRGLIEDSTSQYDDVVSEATVGAADHDRFSARGGGLAAESDSSTAMVASETRAYQERSTDSHYASVNSLYSNAVESAIMNTLLGAGARVVNREALIRNISAGKSRDDRMDIQHLETLALQRGIQYLVEVLPDRNPGSPTGVSFTVKVTHLPTSTIKAQFVTTGDPPKGEAKIVAVHGGFEKRAPESRRTPALVGAQIAYDTMAKLR